MRRYYRSPGDVRDEMGALSRVGRLHPSVAQVLRLELSLLQVSAAAVVSETSPYSSGY